MRSFLLIPPFFLMTMPLKAGVGMGDWQNITPGGNIMEDNTFRFPSDTQEIYLQIWYFYKNHLIGQTYPDSELIVINESSRSITRFKDIQKWKAYLDQESLIPKIWIRWYDTDWKVYPIIEILCLMLLPFLLLILLPVLIHVIYKIIHKDLNLKVKKWEIKTGIFIICLLVIRWLMDIYPQSF